jgi:hypothetical protein
MIGDPDNDQMYGDPRTLGRTRVRARTTAF